MYILAIVTVAMLLAQLLIKYGSRQHAEYHKMLFCFFTRMWMLAVKIIVIINAVWVGLRTIAVVK